MKIFIRDSKGKATVINISDSIKKVSNLKNLIKKDKNITNEIELIFNGMILEDDYDLEELEIKDGDIIDYLGTFLAGLNKCS